MITWCRDETVVSYAELFRYAMDHRQDWFRVLCDNGTVVVKEYLKSMSWEIEYQKKRDDYIHDTIARGIREGLRNNEQS